MPFLIDSNVLIDVSRGNAAAIKYVDGLADGLHVFDSLVAATAMERRSPWSPSIESTIG
jgi:predicted nucleic acid-binding protein